MQAGGAEDHVMVQSLQIVRPQAEPAPRILQLTAQGTQTHEKARRNDHDFA